MIMSGLTTFWTALRAAANIHCRVLINVCLHVKSNFCSEVFVPTSSKSDLEDKVEVFQGHIPKEKLTISFSRSSGPGGQNVNKLNTKAEVRFHVLSAEWIPHRVRQRVIALHKTRMTKFGEMIVMSQKYRTQQKNLEDAIQKLRQLLLEASEVPKGPSELTVARVQALKRKADRKRRVDKKYHSIKKTFRKQIDID